MSCEPRASLEDGNYADELADFISEAKEWGLLVDACKDERTDETITKIFIDDIKPRLIEFRDYLRNAYERTETKEEAKQLWEEKLIPLHKGLKNNYFEYLFRNLVHEPPLEPEFLLALYYADEKDFIIPIRFRNAVDGKYQSMIEKWDAA